MITLLAGRVAASRVQQDMPSLREVILMRWKESTCESENEWRESFDEARALDIAEALSNKAWPPLRILSMMENWTQELLDDTLVQEVHETLVQKLSKDGEIVERGVYEELVEPIQDKWIDDSVWRRRFFFSSPLRLHDASLPHIFHISPGINAYLQNTIGTPA